MTGTRVLIRWHVRWVMITRRSAHAWHPSIWCPSRAMSVARTETTTRVPSSSSSMHAKPVWASKWTTTESVNVSCLPTINQPVNLRSVLLLNIWKTQNGYLFVRSNLLSVCFCWSHQLLLGWINKWFLKLKIFWYQHAKVLTKNKTHVNPAIH